GVARGTAKRAWQKFAHTSLVLLHRIIVSIEVDLGNDPEVALLDLDDEVAQMGNLRPGRRLQVERRLPILIVGGCRMVGHKAEDLHAVLRRKLDGLHQERLFSVVGDLAAPHQNHLSHGASFPFGTDALESLVMLTYDASVLQ